MLAHHVNVCPFCTTSWQAKMGQPLQDVQTIPGGLGQESAEVQNMVSLAASMETVGGTMGRMATFSGAYQRSLHCDLHGDRSTLLRHMRIVPEVMNPVPGVGSCTKQITSHMTTQPDVSVSSS